MKKCVGLIVFLISVLFNTNSYCFDYSYNDLEYWVIKPRGFMWYKNPMEPGSYLNPYVIKKRPLTGEYEIRPKYPHLDPFRPGGYLNPYIIKPTPWGEYQIKPKYPAW